jgi:hypothetical protein
MSDLMEKAKTATHFQVVKACGINFVDYRNNVPEGHEYRKVGAIVPRTLPPGVEGPCISEGCVENAVRRGLILPVDPPQTAAEPEKPADESAEAAPADPIEPKSKKKKKAEAPEAPANQETADPVV